MKQPAVNREHPTIRLPGISLRIECEFPALLDAILAAYGCSSSSLIAANWTLRACIQIEQLCVPEHVRRAVEHVIGRNDWQSEYIRHPRGTIVVFSVPDAPLIAYLDASEHCIYLVAYRPDRNKLAAMPAVTCVLNPLLRDALLQQGYFLLHAAGVQLQGDRGVLFIADNGGGKTTTAIQLTRSGARFLSDDLVLLHRTETDNWVASAVRENLNLSPNTLDFFKMQRPAPDTNTESTRAKYPIPPDRIFAAANMCDLMSVRAICRVQLSGTHPELYKIRAADMLPSILRAHSFSSRQRPDAETFLRFAELSDQFVTLELVTGDHPARIRIQDFDRLVA